MKAFTTKEDIPFVKLYNEFLIAMPTEQAVMLSYLLNLTGNPHIRVDNYNYMRLSSSYIQERIKWSEPTIRKRLNELMEAGFIDIQHRDETEFGKKISARWIKLNYSKVHSLLGTTFTSETTSEATNEATSETTGEKS